MGLADDLAELYKNVNEGYKVIGNSKTPLNTYLQGVKDYTNHVANTLADQINQSHYLMQYGTKPEDRVAGVMANPFMQAMGGVIQQGSAKPGMRIRTTGITGPVEDGLLTAVSDARKMAQYQRIGPSGEIISKTKYDIPFKDADLVETAGKWAYTPNQGVTVVRPSPSKTNFNTAAVIPKSEVPQGTYEDNQALKDLALWLAGKTQ